MTDLICTQKASDRELSLCHIEPKNLLKNKRKNVAVNLQYLRLYVRFISHFYLLAAVVCLLKEWTLVRFLLRPIFVVE